MPASSWVRQAAMVIAGLGLGLAVGLIIASRQKARCARAEEALRLREERYRRFNEQTPSGIEHNLEDRIISLLQGIVEGTNDAVFAKDTQGRYMVFNSAAARLTAKKAGEVIGRDDTALFPAADAIRLMGNDRRVMQHGRVETFDEILTLADGMAHTLSVIKGPLRDAAGKVVGMFGISRDVTDRSNVTQALRQSEERLSSAQHMAHLGSWEMKLDVLDQLDVNPLWWSDEVYRLFGHTPGQVLATNELFFQAVHPDDRPRVAAAVREAVDSCKPYSLEHRIVLPDGSERFVHERAEVVCDPSGKPLRLDGTVQDITDRKRAEEMRAQLEAQLRQAQKMEAVGQLAGGVAHDFNNILAAMLMQLELLKQEAAALPKVRAGLSDLRLLAERAASLTRQLLLFGRRQLKQPRVFDLNSLLGNLLKMLGRLIGEHITLAFQGGQQALWVEADAGMIEQVITNLVINARDAMPLGGRLTLQTREVVVDDAHVAAHPQGRVGRFAALEVRDTGSGMDEATLKRIFEPFFSTKDVGKGTGLGLSTVYGIIDQHEGWIEVRSAIGEGSTFTVYLPARETPQPEPDQEAADTPITGGKEMILVVEDEPVVRRLTVETLKRYGYKVLEAPNGPAALGVWQEHGSAVNLLLSDVVMPDGLGGFELADRLRKPRPDLRVILMSGYSAEMMSQGFDVPRGTLFLQKPFTPRVLARVVRESLDAKQPEEIKKPAA